MKAQQITRRMTVRVVKDWKCPRPQPRDINNTTKGDRRLSRIQDNAHPQGRGDAAARIRDFSRSQGGSPLVETLGATVSGQISGNRDWPGFDGGFLVGVQEGKGRVSARRPLGWRMLGAACSVCRGVGNPDGAKIGRASCRERVFNWV